MKIFRRNTNGSERSAMNVLKVFGHADRETDLITWLDQTYNKESLQAKRYKKIAELFLKYGSVKVLEIAAGVGDFSLMCRKLYPKNDYYISELADKYLQDNISKAAKFFGVRAPQKLYPFPAEKIEFSANTFDLVMIRSAVHHFEKPHAAFSEIYRVLKPGGRLVFFNDPVCLNIPIYKNWRQFTFSPQERQRGIKENIYPLTRYLSFGTKYSQKDYIHDPVYLADFYKNFQKWKGLKKFLGQMLIKNKTLFESLLIYGYGIPFIFVYTK